MERSVTELLGGGLKPNEPRRFLLEAMIGAMYADGEADARETAVLEHRLAQHPLFHGLGPAARTLIDLATDAIRYAANAASRTPAIAKGLPARIHRLAAYALAAEIVVADQSLHANEAAYLEALRIALRITHQETTEIMQAATGGWIGQYLEGVYVRVKALMPHVCEVFTLRALMRNQLHEQHRLRLREFFDAIPDLMVNDTDAELLRAFQAPRSPTALTLDELVAVASRIPDYADRYWVMIYALIAEDPVKVQQWRIRPFTRVMQTAFRFGDPEMELAVGDALTFPAALPRP